MRVMAFAASHREASWNRKLIEAATALVRREGHEVDLPRFREFDVPPYDGDLEHSSGLPTGATELIRRLSAADALMIASPEYNYSMPGHLKNLIDWVSRSRPMPWRGKNVYLLSASPSTVGGIRGLWQLRVPLEGCGSFVFPDMFSLARAHEAFGEKGRLRDPANRARLEKEICGFLRLAEATLDLSRGLGGADRRPETQEIRAALEEQSEIQDEAEKPGQVVRG